jgi:hypothetical protein
LYRLTTRQAWLIALPSHSSNEGHRRMFRLE